MKLDPVKYEVKHGLTFITMDDGKRNVMSLQMLAGLDQALAAAENSKSVVVIRGRPDVLCVGFDLNTLLGEARSAYRLVSGGFDLLYRIYSFPFPAGIACNGHSRALGLLCFLLGIIESAQ